jgi:hypothetical protein
MKTQADYDRQQAIYDRISATFGDWTLISDDLQGTLQVVWDFSPQDLGIHYGWVSVDSDGYFSDWGIEKTCENAAYLFAVEIYDYDLDRQGYASPKGFSDTPHWFKKANAKKYAKKYADMDAKVLIWYNV